MGAIKLLSRLERHHLSLFPFEFKIGQRVKSASGESGRIVDGWHAPGHISYAIEKDNGQIAEFHEMELRPAVEEAK